MTPKHTQQAIEILSEAGSAEDRLEKIRQVFRAKYTTCNARKRIAENRDFLTLAEGLHERGLLDRSSLAGAYSAIFCHVVNNLTLCDKHRSNALYLSYVDWDCLVADLIAEIEDRWDEGIKQNGSIAIAIAPHLDGYTNAIKGDDIPF